MSNVYVHFSLISFPARYSVVNLRLESHSLRFREVIRFGRLPKYTLLKTVMTFFWKVAKENRKKFINRSTNIRKYAEKLRMLSAGVIYAHQIPCPRKTGAASPTPCPCGWTASSCSPSSSGQTQPPAFPHRSP